MNITVRVQSAQAQREVAALEAEIKALKAQMGMANAAAGQLASRGMSETMAKWGSQFQWAGRQLMTNFTYPLVASGALITKWILDNESGMVRLQKVYGDAATGTALFKSQQEQLAEVMDLLSVKYATQRKDVLAIAGDWAAAGATGAELATGVETTLKTMVLGEMEAAEATEALIAIQAQYGANSEQLIGIIEKLNATENSTGVTFSGLVEGMARSASAAREAGVDVDHLAAMIAAISPAAGSAAQGGNALKTIFSRLLGPTGEAREVLGMMGIDIDDVGWKSLNASERLEALATAYHNLDGASEDVISSQAGIVSAVVASRWQINKFGVLMRDIYSYVDNNAETNGYYGKTLDLLADQALVSQTAFNELNAVLTSSPYAVKRAGVEIQNGLMKILAQLMPQIMWLINAVSELITRFSQLDPGLQKAVLGFLALLAAIGPPMALMGAFAVGIGRIGILFKELGGGFKGILRWFGLFRTEQAKQVAGNKTVAASSVESAGVQAKASRSFAGAFRAATASVISNIELMKIEYALLATAGINASKQGIVARATEAAASSSAAKVISASYLEVEPAILRMQAGMQRGAAATKGAWTAMATATKTGVSQVVTSAGHLAVALPGHVISGTEKASTAYLKFTNITLPVAMERGVDAANLAAYRGLNAMTAIMSRSMMENLAVLNGYVNAAAATGARGVAQMNAAMGAAAAAGAGRAKTAAAAAGGVGAAAMASGFVTKLKGVGPAIMKFFRELGPKIVPAIKVIGPAIGRAVLGIGKFFTGPIGLAIAAALALIVAFRDQIGQLFQNVGAQFADATTPFGKAWASVVNLFNKGVEQVHKAFRSLPEGIQGALRAVVNMVKQAAMAVYKFFSYFNPFQRHSPSLVENVTRGMAVVGDQFGLAADRIGHYAMEAYGYLKQWGSATANFMAEFHAAELAADRALLAGSVPQAIDEFDRLTASLVPLRVELQNIGDVMDVQQSIVDRLAASLKQAQDRVTGLQNTMDTLQAAADAASASLDAAQASLDHYATAPLEGMRAMSDAMFENEMQQKALQLALMDWEDVHGSIDDISSRMANLQGDIEALRGEANDLRAAGAGSDILGPINDQIDQMDAAYQAMQDSLADGGISDLQKQLEDLQRQGQRLDLENSLQFDPLTRQIEQAAEAYNELPFDEVLAGVKAQRTEVDKLQQEYNTANDAVKQHQIVLDAANAEVRAAQAAYDVQAASLDNLKTAYEAVDNEIKAIEQSIQDVIDAANGMEDALNRAKNGGKSGGGGGELTPAGENFLGAAGGGFGDVGDANVIGGEGGDLQGWIDQFMADNAKMFEGMDIFGGIKKSWESFQGWWGTNVSPIFTNLWDGLKEIISGIDWGKPFEGLGEIFGPQLKEIWDNAEKALGPAIQKISDALGKFSGMGKPVGDAMTNIGNAIKWLWENILVPFGKFIWTVFVTALSTIFSTIGNIIGPIITFIGDQLTALIDWIRGWVDIFAGIFTGDWDRVLEGIKTTWQATWDSVVSIFTTAWDVVYGLISGLVEGIIEVWNYCYDVLVGHSIIPDMVNAIIGWFVSLWDSVIKWVSDLVTGVVNWFQDMYNRVSAKVGEIIGNVVAWFAGLPAKVGAAVGNLIGTLVQAGSDLVTGLYNGATAAWTTVSTWVGGIAGRVTSALTTSVSTLYNAGFNIISGLFNGMKDRFEDAKDFVLGIGPWIRDHKGPKAYDLQLLQPAGGYIMDGFGQGLAAGFKDVQQQVKGMGPALSASFDVPTNSLGASLTSATNRLASATASAAGTTHQVNETTNINFYGNLEFPNVKGGDDAGNFIRNLNDLAGA